MSKEKGLPVLWVVIPCDNEQEVLPVTAPLFKAQLEHLMKQHKISDASSILFVDDGSKDNTWGIICNLAQQDSIFKGIAQSRNRGHQNAVLAGLMEAKEYADITISIDCDGQDDISAMESMVDEYNNGCEVVYGVRSKRDTDSFFKRSTARAFYKFMRWLGAEVVMDHADYRLISTRVLHELEKFEEVNIFLRGMVPLVGFKSTSVYYERHERMAGKTHYPLRKMVALAVDGITSLSVKPLHMITGFGFLVSIISLIAVVITIIQQLRGVTVQGWASTVSIICFLGGVQLICMGVIGEYIGKMYLETKNAQGILSANEQIITISSRRFAAGYAGWFAAVHGCS